MKTETTQQFRQQPPDCPDHPGSPIQRKETRTVGNPCNRQFYLTQRRCGEPDCNLPLNWESYNPDQQTYRYGPGECRDRTALQNMAYEEHWDPIRPVIIAIAALTALIGSVSIVSITASTAWGWTPAVAACGAIGAATIYAIIKVGRRNEPKTKEFEQFEPAS